MRGSYLNTTPLITSVVVGSGRVGGLAEWNFPSSGGLYVPIFLSLSNLTCILAISIRCTEGWLSIWVIDLKAVVNFTLRPDKVDKKKNNASIRLIRINKKNWNKKYKLAKCYFCFFPFTILITKPFV